MAGWPRAGLPCCGSLLNPLHPDATLLTLEWARHIAYDKRLFRLTDA